MKQHFIPALRLTAVCLVFFSGLYTVAVWAVAQALPTGGLGARTTRPDGTYFYTNVGQAFTDDRYFWSRPSAVDYDAGGSGGSNKGPSDPEYLHDVQARVDTFLAHNPGIRRGDIPSELVTASGSGLDPHITPQGALVQVARVARARGLALDAVETLVLRHQETPWLGIWGKEKINVLRLNLALDEIQQQKNDL